MSGLAGIWHLDQRPGAELELPRLSAALAHRGPDAAGAWSAGNIALASQLLRVSTESTGERQPAIDARGNVLLLDGRLDNRVELLDWLRNREVTLESPDSALILAAWRAWGDAFLQHLNGEFALALFDSKTRTIRLGRDAIGVRPLYYWSNRRTFIFASEVKAILAHPDVPRTFNADLLADFLLLDRLPYDDEAATFFADIHAVRPGHCVTIRGGDLAITRFWDFDAQAQVRYGTDAEYADRLRELLVQAVRRRLRSTGTAPIAIATSGGLDSSIVLCVADDLRRAGAIDAPLVALCCTPDDDPSVEENRFIRLLEVRRGLHVQRVAPGPPPTLDQLVNAAWHSEWPRLDDGWWVQRSMFERARTLGARITVTGLWSDQLQFVTGYLSDLAARLAWREIRAHLAEYGRWFVDADPAYFKSRLRRELFSHFTPEVLRASVRPIYARFQRPSGGSTKWNRTLTDRLARGRERLDRPAAATAHARSIYHVVRAASHRLQFEADEKLAASVGIEAVTPFLDRDLIAYLMAIPGEVQNRGGVPRALLREAMRGIVPDEILARRWRADGIVSGAFVRDHRQRYLSMRVPLEAARALDVLPGARLERAETLELLGLECWSRAFFSDRLAPPQLSFEGDCVSMTTPAAPTQDGETRLPYSAPTLTIHGDLRTITAAKEGNREEAGQPKTYTNTMP